MLKSRYILLNVYLGNCAITCLWCTLEKIRNMSKAFSFASFVEKIVKENAPQNKTSTTRSSTKRKRRRNEPAKEAKWKHLPPSRSLAGDFDNTEFEEIDHISSEEEDASEALNVSKGGKKRSISAVKGAWPAGVGNVGYQEQLSLKEGGTTDVFSTAMNQTRISSKGHSGLTNSCSMGGVGEGISLGTSTVGNLDECSTFSLSTSACLSMFVNSVCHDQVQEEFSDEDIVSLER